MLALLYCAKLFLGKICRIARPTRAEAARRIQAKNFPARFQAIQVTYMDPAILYCPSDGQQIKSLPPYARAARTLLGLVAARRCPTPQAPNPLALLTVLLSPRALLLRTVHRIYDEFKVRHFLIGIWRQALFESGCKSSKSYLMLEAPRSARTLPCLTSFHTNGILNMTPNCPPQTSKQAATLSMVSSSCFCAQNTE